MAAVNLAEAKAHLIELARKAAGGEDTIITRRGQPAAELVPIAVPKKPVRFLTALRATLPKAQKSGAELIRELRDESN